MGRRHERIFQRKKYRRFRDKKECDPYLEEAAFQMSSLWQGIYQAGCDIQCWKALQ